MATIKELLDAGVDPDAELFVMNDYDTVARQVEIIFDNQAIVIFEIGRGYIDLPDALLADGD
jgi:hypothetical protein